MEICRHRLEWFVLAALLAGLAGCGGGSTGTSAVDYTKIRALADMYGAYVADHRNQPPPNEQAFRDYLGTKQEYMQRAGITVDAMFVSPRNGEPIQWVYGRKPPAGGYETYIAYEKTPVDGKWLAITARGTYQEMDEAWFRKVFPNKPQ